MKQQLPQSRPAAPAAAAAAAAVPPLQHTGALLRLTIQIDKCTVVRERVQQLPCQGNRQTFSATDKLLQQQPVLVLGQLW
jgi:hypothetical protein